MSTILEQRYIHLVSPRLQKFRQKDDTLYNFRCPLCGDSKKHKNRTRGYIYLKDGGYVFHCHNCTKTMMFFNFLKQVAGDLYDQYVVERFSRTKEEKDTIFTPKKQQISSNAGLASLKKISLLPPSHPAKKYIVSRQIPTPYHAELYWCPKFKEWTNSIIPEKFDLSKGSDEGRIIIPLLDKLNVMFGFQGRSINPASQLRYISIMMNEDMPKLYNLHRVNMNIRYYVVEGPIDAMFVSNTIASCGGMLTSELDKSDLNSSNATIVYDNQPRNKEVVNNMLTAVKHGYKVCVWPSSLKFKDINDMILSRVPAGEYVRTEDVMKAAEEIKSMIDTNTHSGLQAELRIAAWRKT